MQDQNQNPGTEIATLPPAQRAVIVLGSTKAEAELRELLAKTEAITNVIDKNGREEAHRAGMTLKNARVAIEKIGKAARDDANAFAKAVIAEEKRLVSLVQPEEDRLMNLRNAFDAKVAAEKAEAERKERERVAAIKAKIDAIKGLPAASFGDSAEQIGATLADLEVFDMSEAEFGEFAGDASEAKAVALAGLREMHAKAVAAEAEAARLAEERAEIERQRAAAEEVERQAAAARKAEEDRLRAEREAFEAERRAFAEQQAAATRAEQERIAAEQAAADLPKAEGGSADTLLVIDGAPVTAKALAQSSDGLVTLDMPIETANDDEPVAEEVAAPQQHPENWPLQSFDATDWAKSFMERFGHRRDEIDEALMTAWFANALMRGYDEHARQAEFDAA